MNVMVLFCSYFFPTVLILFLLCAAANQMSPLGVNRAALYTSLNLKALSSPLYIS